MYNIDKVTTRKNREPRGDVTTTNNVLERMIPGIHFTNELTIEEGSLTSRKRKPKAELTMEHKVMSSTEDHSTHTH